MGAKRLYNEMHAAHHGISQELMSLQVSSPARNKIIRNFSRLVANCVMIATRVTLLTLTTRGRHIKVIRLLNHDMAYYKHKIEILTGNERQAQVTQAMLQKSITLYGARDQFE